MDSKDLIILGLAAALVWLYLHPRGGCGRAYRLPPVSSLGLSGSSGGGGCTCGH